VFLTVQLSTVEASIEATDKALKANGYQKIAQEAAAEAARRRNVAMDRQGGGPVNWQEFYGKTAESFFYHPKDGNTLYVNPDAVAQRPPQFDYIYRANEANRAKAEADAARIGTKIGDLLAYRRELESAQSALWCKIAFRGVASLALSEQPLYRLELTGPAGDAGKETVEAAGACVAFIKAIDAAMTAAQGNMDDQKSAIDTLQASTAAARSVLHAKLLTLGTLSGGLTDQKDPLGKFSLLAKRLEDSAQNLVDAYRLAGESDAKEDLAAKRLYRGQMQAMAIDYARTVASAHEALAAATDVWKVKASSGAATPVAVQPADGDAFATRLESAKAAYAAELAAARRRLVGALDARLNAAADAGDLNAVQLLQSAKVKAATDGTLDEAVKDELVLATKKAMDQSIAASRQKLAGAYKETISNLTKARQFTEAVAIQAEFKSTGLDALETAAPVAAEGSAQAPGARADGGGAEPAFAGETSTVKLAGPVEKVVPGGGGNYLILHIKKLRQLAVLDVPQAKVVKYIDLPSDDIVYTAGREKLIIGVQESGALQSWNLKTMTQVLSTRGNVANLKTIAMGCDSPGPLLLVSAKSSSILDPDTLGRPVNLQWDGAWDGAPSDVHMSADGHTAVAYGFPGWAGTKCVVFSGNRPVSYYSGGYNHYNDLMLPPDGSRIFDSMERGRIFSPDYKNQIDLEDLPGYGFPSYDPAYFVAFNEKKERNSGGRSKLVICSVADRRPVVTLNNLPELEGTSPVKHHERVHFIPRLNLLVSLGDTGDNLVLRKLDIYKTLKEQGIDYLVITSSAPYSVAKGKGLSYQMTVKSLQGNVKYALDSAPAGMTITPQGLLRWTAPASTKEESVTVIVNVSDDSKQVAFQAFKLMLIDPSKPPGGR
jgi:hypothetical protein